MKVLVTGSSGFIGSHLLDLLNCRGHQVKGIDIEEPKEGEKTLSYEFEQCDIRNRQEFTDLLARWKPEGVLHLAARTDLEGQTLEDYAANTKGVENLLHAIQKTPSVQRCVVTSSQLVCRTGYVPSHPDDYRPNTLYGQSKVKTEQITRELDGGDTIWCIVRPTTIWGPGMSAHYLRFFRAVQRGFYFHIGDKPLRKSYGYVKNTAHQYLRLLNAPDEIINRQMFYLADYEPLSLRTWIDSFQKKLGAPPVRTLSEPVARMLARAGDLATRMGIKGIPFNSFRLHNIITEYQFDLSGTKEVCGSLPYRMEEGVAETVAWLEDILKSN